MRGSNRPQAVKAGEVAVFVWRGTRWRRMMAQKMGLGGSRECAYVAKPYARALRRCQHQRRAGLPMTVLAAITFKTNTRNRQRGEGRAYLARNPAFVATYVEDTRIDEEVMGK